MAVQHVPSCTCSLTASWAAYACAWTPAHYLRESSYRCMCVYQPTAHVAQFWVGQSPCIIMLQARILQVQVYFPPSILLSLWELGKVLKVWGLLRLQSFYLVIVLVVTLPPDSQGCFFYPLRKGEYQNKSSWVPWSCVSEFWRATEALKFALF